MSAARYIGRVGGLALALGVGATVFGHGVAWADDGTSSTPSSSQSSETGQAAARNATDRGASASTPRPSLRSKGVATQKKHSGWSKAKADTATGGGSSTTGSADAADDAPTAKPAETVKARIGGLRDAVKRPTAALTDALSSLPKLPKPAPAPTIDLTEAVEPLTTLVRSHLPSTLPSSENFTEAFSALPELPTRGPAAGNDFTDAVKPLTKLVTSHLPANPAASEILTEAVNALPKLPTLNPVSLDSLTSAVKPVASLVTSHLPAAPPDAILTAAADAPSVVASTPLGVVAAAVKNVLAPTLGSTPNSPMRPQLFQGLLALVRRELDSVVNNKAPSISYDATKTKQLNGAIYGSVVATDPNNDNLRLTVTDGPDNGTVTLNQDGSFKYVPNPQTLANGGTDTFTVTANDTAGDPLGLKGLFGIKHTASTTVTVVTAPQTSPLLTPEQISSEERAAALIESGALDASKAALKAKWLATQQLTFADTGGVDEQNMALLDAAVDEYANYAALAAVNMADAQAGRPSFIWIAAAPHTEDGTGLGGTRVYYDNPDTMYRMAFVNPGSSYVIHGKVNGELPSDLNITAQVGQTGQAASIITADDLQVNPDGTFTITADSDPTKIGQPNHLYLPPGTQMIFVRDTVTDWNSQQAVDLSIEQVSGTNTEVPPAAVAAIANGIMMQSVNASTDAWLPLSGKAPVNTLPQPANQGSNTLATQMQSIGHFDLADDEALVVTVDPGTAEYFTVPVTNDWTITSDYVNQPTSLNNSQAIPNPDGTYTFVISKSDPGVANWVSTGGLNQGTIFIRLQQLDPTSTDVPTVSTKVVRVDDLEDELPETTVWYTPEDRAKQIAERQSGWALRTSPYVVSETLAESAEKLV
ncbi:Ig-like domain-containing protein [Mycobacterium sp. DBP42]|uniref:Ig-like domain-containing protein n=1 Tax=Mycobacterium sp. DBP42 TaxID=2545267 RepID=UPI00110CDA2D|nr:Ig-like domain-containing protein [Mycobacterium sp. DBP42]TMS52135.1 DUF1214 domain-containing protein [Mycobacterium sp. DBP42]